CSPADRSSVDRGRLGRHEHSCGPAGWCPGSREWTADELPACLPPYVVRMSVSGYYARDAPDGMGEGVAACHKRGAHRSAPISINSWLGRTRRGTPALWGTEYHWPPLPCRRSPFPCWREDPCGSWSGWYRSVRPWCCDRGYGRRQRDALQ